MRAPFLACGQQPARRALALTGPSSVLTLPGRVLSASSCRTLILADRSPIPRTSFNLDCVLTDPTSKDSYTRVSGFNIWVLGATQSLSP